MKSLLKKQSKRVLIVEDDMELSSVLERVLHEIDPHMSTECVSRTEDAVSRLRKSERNHSHPYDMVVADIFLEGESTGLDLWKICNESLPNVAFIVTSALSPEKFFKAIGTEMIAPPFLPKPFSLTECKRLFEGVLSYAPAKGA